MDVFLIGWTSRDGGYDHIAQCGPGVEMYDMVNMAGVVLAAGSLAHMSSKQFAASLQACIGLGFS